ncbi:MAG: MFS transporter, partial [Pseudomonadota bacterium]
VGWPHPTLENTMPVRRAVTVSMILLFGVSLFNYMDRYMLAVLLPAIKADLDLSDTQLGIISGFAFTLFYATLGIPIARLADRYSRRKIISVALAIWSAMTALCGLAQSFLQLTIARVLVGVGEAGASPPSHSLIADYYPVEQRTRAISIYSLGAPIGILLGFIIGSRLAEAYSWRIALIAVGLPGMLLAVAVWRSLHEPPRGATEQRTAPTAQPSFRSAAAMLARSPAFIYLSVATGFYTVVWLGVVQWLPSYFTRSFDLTLGHVGFWLAIVLGFSQIAGMLLSGAVTDRLIRRHLRWYALLPAIAILVSTPIFAAVFWTTSATLGLVLLFPTFMISVMQGPATFAAVQGLVPPPIRATAAAVLLLITNLIGGGIGPPLVGWLSDRLAATQGDESLRVSLLIVATGFSLLASLSYLLASRSIGREFHTEMRTTGN